MIYELQTRLPPRPLALRGLADQSRLNVRRLTPPRIFQAGLNHVRHAGVLNMILSAPRMPFAVRCETLPSKQ